MLNPVTNRAKRSRIGCYLPRDCIISVRRYPFRQELGATGSKLCDRLLLFALFSRACFGFFGHLIAVELFELPAYGALGDRAVVEM